MNLFQDLSFLNDKIVDRISTLSYIFFLSLEIFFVKKNKVLFNKKENFLSLSLNCKEEREREKSKNNLYPKRKIVLKRNHNLFQVQMKLDCVFLL